MSEAPEQSEASTSLLFEYLELAKKGKVLWAALAGMALNAFLVTNLLLKLSNMSISDIFSRIVEIYRDAVGFFFFPFEFIFDIQVPWYILRRQVS